MTPHEKEAITDITRRTTLAHEPTTKEIETIFKENPSTLVILTPRAIIPKSDRKAVFLRHRRPYIAGPMRGYEKFNFPAFDEARDRIQALGQDPISPADLDRNSGLHECDAIKDEDVARILRECIRRDVDAICDHCDCVVLLKGWEKSKGVAVEVALAHFLGMPVYELEEYIDAQRRLLS